MQARSALSRTVVAMTLAACATPDASSSVGLMWPVDPDAITDPAAMVVEPDRAAGGEVISVSFPDEPDRGILYALDAQIDGEWTRMFLLVSDANGGEPVWYRSDDSAAVVEAVGIAGPGPDHVVVPVVASPGTYRLCTANAVTNYCAPFEVAGA